jgi:hypothetical protein
MKTPAADRKVLVLLAGFVWSLVGLGLVAAGVFWMVAHHGNVAATLAVSVVGGAIVFRFGFSKLVTVNLERIYSQSPGKKKVCIFSFQNRRSYFIVAIMISMGYALRHSPLPKIYLAPVYMTIGLGLLLSSLRYYTNAH